MPGQADSLGAIPFLSVRQGFLGPRNSSLGLPRDGVRCHSLKVPMTDFIVVPGKTEVSRLELEDQTTLPTFAAHSSSGQDTLGLNERHCL